MDSGFHLQSRRMFPTHCSDEELLSCLDGELAPPARDAVEKHLRQCWSCRRRAAELEETVRAISTSLDESGYPGPQWVAETKLKLAERQKQIDRDLAAVPKLGVLANRFPQELRVATIGLVLLLVPLGLWWFWSLPGEPSAAEVLASVQEAEGQFHQQPTYQAFRVEFIQDRPQRVRNRRQLEIWSDPRRGRLVSRWRDEVGNLKHAVYRPERGREYIYDPGIAPGAVVPASRPPQQVSVAELGENGLAVEQLETSFMKWLESREWQPLSFAAGLSSFASRDGLVLTVERVGMPGGHGVFQISARRTDRQLSVELLMEVDPQTYRPRLYEARFETAHRVVHLRVIPEEFELIPAARLTPAIFEPDFPLYRLVRPPVAAKRPPVAPERKTQSPTPAPRPSEAELAATEVEALYALHQVRACLGDPVKITRDPSWNLVVRGIVSTSERKAQLLAALADLNAPPWLRYDLRTVDEALLAASRDRDPDTEAAGEDTGNVSRAPDELAMQIDGDRLPIQDQLERYFRVKDAEENSDGADERIRQFAGKIVTLSGDALAEVWAIRRLAEKRRLEKAAEWQPRTRWLLEVMLREHLTALQAKAAQMRRLLEPVLSESLAPTAGSDIARSANPGVGAGSQQRASVRSAGADILQVFGLVEQIRSQVLSLFANGGPEYETKDAAASGRVRMHSPEETARALLDILPQVEAEARRLGRDPALVFSREAEAEATVHNGPAALPDAPL